MPRAKGQFRSLGKKIIHKYSHLRGTVAFLWASIHILASEQASLCFD